MEDFGAIILTVWIIFSSAATLDRLVNNNITYHSTIIEKCTKAGLVQYNTTVINCQVKEPK